MRVKEIKVPDTIWKDKRIPKETKYVYCYIYSKGNDKLITDINVGEVQQTYNINNKGLRKSMKILEELKYLTYNEYSNGMYSVTLN